MYFGLYKKIALPILSDLIYMLQIISGAWLFTAVLIIKITAKKRSLYSYICTCACTLVIYELFAKDYQTTGI